MHTIPVMLYIVPINQRTLPDAVRGIFEGRVGQEGRLQRALQPAGESTVDISRKKAGIARRKGGPTTESIASNTKAARGRIHLCCRPSLMYSCTMLALKRFSSILQDHS